MTTLFLLRPNPLLHVSNSPSVSYPFIYLSKIFKRVMVTFSPNNSTFSFSVEMVVNNIVINFNSLILMILNAVNRPFRIKNHVTFSKFGLETLFFLLPMILHYILSGNVPTYYIDLVFYS